MRIWVNILGVGYGWAIIFSSSHAFCNAHFAIIFSMQISVSACTSLNSCLFEILTHFFWFYIVARMCSHISHFFGQFSQYSKVCEAACCLQYDFHNCSFSSALLLQVLWYIMRISDTFIHCVKCSAIPMGASSTHLDFFNTLLLLPKIHFFAATNFHESLWNSWCIPLYFLHIV